MKIMSATNLASMSSCALRTFLDSFDNVLCDCSGVVWWLHKPIPGVQESLTKLRENGKRVGFVSNNSSLSLRTFHTCLNRLKYDAKEDDIVYPTLAILSYIRKIQYDKDIFLFGTSAMGKEFSRAGFKIVNDMVLPVECLSDRISEEPIKLLTFLQDNLDIGAVIVDVDLKLSYSKLAKATVYLRRPEVLFIAGATDKRLSVGSKLVIMVPKYFQDALKELSNRVPLCFAKPSENFNKYVMKKFNILNPSRALFIGNSLHQDMKFASECGFQKLLVLTGVTNLDEMEKCTDTDLIPDYYISSLGDLHQLLRSK